MLTKIIWMEAVSAGGALPIISQLIELIVCVKFHMDVDKNYLDGGCISWWRPPDYFTAD